MGLAQAERRKTKSRIRKKPYKHIEIEDLRAFIAASLEDMLGRNSTRTPLPSRQRMKSALEEVLDDELPQAFTRLDNSIILVASAWHYR
ncbi:MAG TPA: hypothetical protein VFK24_06050 [Gammaproteobacteria bacterium]|nr:hypothetical protein [Gammaproteobacteria bacterium]